MTYAGWAELQPLDEMVDGAGRTRRHWREVTGRAFNLGGEGLRERARLLEHAALEEGAASLLAGVDARAWRCDPLPLPLEAAEFDRLADGLAQRARIIDTILDDLYGPQTLLARGVVPARLVFGSRAFLRPARIAEPASRPRRHLSFYAADLIRTPDGQWCVLADACACPGGAGFALENRRLLQRIVPELFHPGLEPLDPFFERWRDSLREASPEPRPGVALLTEGHRDPAWFEHVLLSRELDLDLVQGNDLTLRGGRLFLKTLRGLKRVDVLLNRLPPPLLDPLELDWHESAGVPGLMSAWRGGRIAILDDPGAALAETPGFAACLPSAAAALTGETLRIPQIETVWLGEPEAAARLVADPDGWLLCTAGRADIAPVALSSLSARARSRALDALDRDPGRFAAVARTIGSVIPAVGSGGLEAQPFVLRLFLIREGDRWTALRGGFARLVAPDRPPGVVLPADGVAKDVFVLADREHDEARLPVQSILPLGRPAPLAIRRTEGDVPARVAEEFFQLGRRLEIFETDARLVRALATRLARFVHRPRELVELRILATCLASGRLIPGEQLIDPAAPGLARSLVGLTDATGPLAEQARQLLAIIDRLRDRLTAGMHLILTQSLGDLLGAFAGPAGDAPTFDGLAHVTGRMLGVAAMLAGLAAESMVRGGGRLFLELGMRLTRAEQVCHELSICLGPAASLPGHGRDLETGLAVALELRDSAITYRARYLSRLEPLPALDLLLADPANPRALSSQLDAVAALLTSLGDAGGAGLQAAADRLADDNRDLLTGSPETDAVLARLAALAAGITTLRHSVARRYLDLLPEMRTIG